VSAVTGHYGYWMTIALMVAGMYIVIARGNLLKKLLGLAVLQSSVYLLYIGPAKLVGGTAPIIAEGYAVYSNPLPHVLILTAIVVGVATLALGLAIVVRIREAYGSIEEDEILARDRAEEDGTADRTHDVAR
jgi:multicomponent Na+:H+ antiporter subunit C